MNTIELSAYFLGFRLWRFSYMRIIVESHKYLSSSMASQIDKEESNAIVGSTEENAIEKRYLIQRKTTLLLAYHYSESQQGRQVLTQEQISMFTADLTEE